MRLRPPTTATRRSTRTCCASCSKSPKPASIRRRSSDLYSNRRHCAHLRGAAAATTRSRCRCKPVPLTAEAMPEVSADFTRLDGAPAAAASCFADDPAFKGKPRELVAADYVYAFKRIYDPGIQEPGVQHARRGGHPRSRRDPGTCAARQEAVRLRQRRRRPARARPLHAAVQARQAAPALRDDARREHVRGGRARGGRGLSATT